MPAGRPRLLDDTRKAEIIGIISAGGSRTMAAEFVGCALTTIYAEARRDEEFDRQLRRAAVRPILWHLNNIQKQAERSWRASAWLLERAYPQQFARRGAETMTRDDFNQAANLLLDTAQRVLGRRAARRLEKHFQQIGDRLQSWAAEHSRPFEHGPQPRACDHFEAEAPLEANAPREAASPMAAAPTAEEPTADPMSAETDTSPEPAADQGTGDDPRRQRRRRRAERRRMLHCLKTGKPYRVQRPDGSWYEYDKERLREAVEFARPRPHPHSADWHDHCQRMRRRALRKAKLWRERQRRGVYDLNAPLNEPSPREPSPRDRFPGDPSTRELSPREAPRRQPPPDQRSLCEPTSCDPLSCEPSAREPPLCEPACDSSTCEPPASRRRSSNPRPP
jgi:hypothetical protein